MIAGIFSRRARCLARERTKRSKHGATAPKFTASSVLAATHGCTSPASAVRRHIQVHRSAGLIVDDANPPNADGSMSTCGIRSSVSVTGAPDSVMPVPGETVTAVVFGERMRGVAQRHEEEACTADNLINQPPA